jgi:hypothetical protein
MLASFFLQFSALCSSFTDPGGRELKKKERKEERK